MSTTNDLINIGRGTYLITETIKYTPTITNGEKINLANYVVSMLSDKELRITTSQGTTEKPQNLSDIRSAKDVFLLVVSIFCNGEKYYQFVDAGIGTLEEETDFDSNYIKTNLKTSITYRPKASYECHHISTTYTKYSKEKIESIAVNKFYLKKEAITSINFHPADVFSGKVEEWLKLYPNNADKDTIRQFMELGVIDTERPLTSELKIKVPNDIHFTMEDRTPLPEERPSIELGLGPRPGYVWESNMCEDGEKTDYDFVIYDQYQGWYRHYRIIKGAKTPVKYLYKGDFQFEVIVECDNLVVYGLRENDKSLVNKGQYKNKYKITERIPLTLIEKLTTLHKKNIHTIEKDSKLWNEVVSTILPDCKKEVISLIRESIDNE